MLCSLCFFFNDTATTEIYTYCHPPSLHDALPISLAAPPARPTSRATSSSRTVPIAATSTISRSPIRAAALISSTIRPRRCWPTGRRSEEHTSELQSLMRISYAVFCLKKKKHDNSNVRQHYNQHTTQLPKPI